MVLAEGHVVDGLAGGYLLFWRGEEDVCFGGPVRL
jgi:hypothetical protein